MDQEKLRDFIMLSETLSFSEAAERRYMTQSALSKRIHSLEKELGESLFIRSSRSIRLSDFGEEFLPFARQIMTGYESAEMFLSRYRYQHRKQVTLASVSNPECYHIDRIYMGFQKEYPEIKLDLREDQLLKLSELFHSGKANLYCTCDLILKEGASFIPAGEGYLVALCPKNDPLSGKTELTPYDLENKNLLLPEEVDPFYIAVMDKFSECSLSPNIVYKGAALSSISLVKSGIGISILPVEVAFKYSDPEIRIIRFTPEIRYTFGLGYRSWESLSESERTFVEYVKAFLQSQHGLIRSYDTL